MHGPVRGREPRDEAGRSPYALERRASARWPPVIAHAQRNGAQVYRYRAGRRIHVVAADAPRLLGRPASRVRALWLRSPEQTGQAAPTSSCSFDFGSRRTVPVDPDARDMRSCCAAVRYRSCYARSRQRAGAPRLRLPGSTEMPLVQSSGRAGDRRGARAREGRPRARLARPRGRPELTVADGESTRGR